MPELSIIFNFTSNPYIFCTLHTFWMLILIFSPLWWEKKNLKKTGEDIEILEERCEPNLTFHKSTSKETIIQMILSCIFPCISNIIYNWQLVWNHETIYRQKGQISCFWFVLYAEFTLNQISKTCCSCVWLIIYYIIHIL